MNINSMIMRCINVLLMIILFWGCNRALSEDVNEQKISFRSNIQETQVVNMGRASFDKGGGVHLYIVERTEEDVAMFPASEDLCEMVCGDAGSLSFADGQEHYYPDMPIDVYGYYWKKTHSAPQDLVSVPVSVNADQSTPEFLNESDFLYLKAANGYVKDVAPIRLEFNHLFSKLVINFTTETPTTVILGDLEEVKLNNVVTTGILNMGTGVLANGETVDDIQMQAIPNTSVVIFPQEKQENDMIVSFKFTGNDSPSEAILPSMTFEPGKEYVYTLKVNDYPGLGPTKELFLVSIKDWEQVQAGEILVEKGEKARVTLAEVVKGIVITKADLYMSSGGIVRKVKNIVVTNNQMEFVFPRTVEGGTLQLDSACFYTETGEKFAYCFTDITLKGNNHDEVTLTIPKVGDAWMGGTVFVVGKVTGYDETTSSFKTDITGINAYRGRVVASVSLGSKAWCESSAKGKNSLVGASSRYDGMINLKAVETFAASNGETLDAYPAFKACKDLGEGWYFPALDEIRWIALHKEELNLSMEVKAYGSSMEKSVVDYVGITSSITSDNLTTKYGPSAVWPVRAY